MAVSNEPQESVEKKVPANLRSFGAIGPDDPVDVYISWVDELELRQVGADLQEFGARLVDEIAQLGHHPSILFGVSSDSIPIPDTTKTNPVNRARIFLPLIGRNYLKSPITELERKMFFQNYQEGSQTAEAIPVLLDPLISGAIPEELKPFQISHFHPPENLPRSADIDYETLLVDIQNGQIREIAERIVNVIFTSQKDAESKEETTETKFSSDRPETMRDMLGRAPLAFALAHKINDIYTEQNSRAREKRSDGSDAPAFILHIDSPWGGGKTTFANYVARILNPSRFDIDPKDEEKLKGTFFEHLKINDKNRWPEKYRDRKWIDIHFNAWQHQHVSPPWWDFYEAIRKQAMDASPLPTAIWQQVREASWRIFSPQFWRTILTVGIFSVFVFIVFQIPLAMDWISATSEQSAAPFVLATITGASGLAIIGAVRGGIRKLIDSAGGSTDITTLGTSDPMRRFRNHFSKSVRDLGRPVLIIVDDLDRCEPDYVVELIRGMLTVFRSPRIVFILLGDRNWIETAFEQVHQQMADAHHQSEISFGGRFVEKAIQMSLLLPEPHKSDRDSYFNQLLLRNEFIGDNETDIEDLKATLDQNLVDGSTLEQQHAVVDKLLQNSPDVSDAARQMLHSTKAVISAAQITESRKNIEHAIAPLTDLLPPNPRRVKRIVNMIAVYHASAHAIFNVTKNDTPDRWYQVILWVMLLSEHPQCWKLLCSKPDPQNRTDDEKKKLDAPEVARLLDGNALDNHNAMIDKDAVLWLRSLTPIR